MMKTEEKILEAALEVVEERTISGTRMHHIADKADVVQSNVHYYYKTKKDLLKALQEKVLKHCQEIREQEKKELGGGFDHQMQAFINQKKKFILEEKKYDYAEIDFWMQGRLDQDMCTEFRKSFSNWRKEIELLLEEYYPEITPEQKIYIPALMVSMLEGASIQYLIDEESFNLEKYFMHVMDVIHYLVGEDSHLCRW